MFQRFFKAAIAMLCTTFAAPALAQDARIFDCPALLSAIGFQNSTPSQDQLTLELISNFNPKDPISIRELPKTRSAPYLLSDLPSFENDKTISCHLIVVEFYAIEDGYQFDLNLVENTRATSIPILLVRGNDTPAAARERTRAWAQQNYNIQALFKDTVRKTQDEVSGALSYQISVNGARLSEPNFLELDSSSLQRSRVLTSGNAPTDVKSFLLSANVQLETPIFMLCAPGPCEDIKSQIFGATDNGQATSQTDTEADKPILNISRPPARPAEQEEGATETVQRVATTPTLLSTAHIQYRDGRVLRMDEFGIARLECALMALGADVFASSDSCEDHADAMQRLAALEARISLSSSGAWIIQEGAAIETPERVVLKLPEGFDHTPCLFDLFYTSDAGRQVQLPLDPRLGQDGGVEIRGRVSTPFLIDAGQVRAKLVNTSGSEECKITSQDITLPASSVLEIPLDFGTQRLRGLAHVFLIDGRELEEGLGLENADATDLARKSMDAVQAAHFRLSQTRAGQDWSLANATISALSGRGNLQFGLNLDANSLRNRVQGAFADADRFRNSLSNAQVAIDAKALEDAISPLQDAATEQGLSALTVTLLSYVQPDTSAAVLDLCDGALFRDAATRLNSRSGAAVNFEVFSLARHAPALQPLETSRLQPRSFSPAALAEGGAYTCANSDPSVSIHPFIIEPWRDSVDVAARYATALSDQLTLIIEDAISEGTSK